VRLDHPGAFRSRTLLRALLIEDGLLPQLAPTHRQRLIRVLTHLLGEQTWYGIERHLASPTPEGEALYFLAGVPIEAQDPLLQKRIAARANIDAGQGLPRETLYGLRGVYHRELPRARVRTLAAIATANGRQDGPLTALYKAGLLELSAQELGAQLPAHVQVAVGGLPTVDAHVAIVLDLSASAAASGERVYHPSALGLALWLYHHGVLPLYTPLSGSWLNMAESIQRILVRRALDGQHPQTPQQIIAWLEETVAGWTRSRHRLPGTASALNSDNAHDSGATSGSLTPAPAAPIYP
jgi:hypothetical protein